MHLPDPQINPDLVDQSLARATAAHAVVPTEGTLREVRYWTAMMPFRAPAFGQNKQPTDSHPSTP
jgi:hypothetical protein